MLPVLIQVDAFQMGTHNIYLYKEVDKKYTGCKLKTTELLDCVLIWVCVVIRLNTVSFLFFYENIFCGYAIRSASVSIHSICLHGEAKYPFIFSTKIYVVGTH